MENNAIDIKANIIPIPCLRVIVSLNTKNDRIIVITGYNAVIDTTTENSRFVMAYIKKSVPNEPANPERTE